MRLLAALPAVSVVGLLVCSCGGGNTASNLAKAPTFNAEKCGVKKSHDHPFIVEWASADRLELESKARQGLVAVRYVGCEMDVLERCSVNAKYNYVAGTRKQDELDINNEDDLYASLPVGALKLESRLQRSGKLTVKMDLVGRYESEKSSVRADELQGDCQGATHFIYGVTLGAFDFYAGGTADVGGGVGVGGVGAGGDSKASRTSITKDGDPDACAKAATSDRAPPDGCGALVRIEVVPISAASVGAAKPSPPATAVWLGVRVEPDLAGAVHGVRVLAVAPQSPADAAGLKPTIDLITAVDGAPIDSAATLADVVGKHAPGDTVKLMVLEQDNPREIPVVLRQPP